MIKVNGNQVVLDHFPDGTLLLKGIELSSSTIEWYFENNEELVALYFITRHIKELRQQKIHLIMKYIPNARQDRIHSDKDVLTLKYFAELINSLKFETVTVLDAHSNVALALLDRVRTLPIAPYLEKAIELSGMQEGRDILFYPDEGSQKRYSQIIKFPHAFGYKKRRWEDGEIIGLEVMGEVPNQPFNVLIIDDISSFGSTFLHSAKKLKQLGAEKIYLYITHCEDTILEGELIKSGLIEHIYTTDSLFTKSHELITII